MNETIYNKLKKQININLTENNTKILLSEALKSVSVAKHREEIRSGGVVKKDYLERIKQDFEVEIIKCVDGISGKENGLVGDVKISHK